MPEPITSLIPAERLAEARQAMEGEMWRKKREAEAQTLLKRREEARRAMEGRERQIKRQVAEAEKLRIKNQAAATVQAAADKVARERAEAQSAVSAEREKTRQTAAFEEARRQQAAAQATKIEQMRKLPNEMSAVRTFKTDLAAAAGGASITKTIIRGQSSTIQGIPTQSDEAHTGRWLFLILILLLLGGGTFGYVYWMKTQPQTSAGSGSSTTTPPAGGSTLPAPVKPLFIFTDKQMEIKIDGAPRADLVLQLRQAINDGAVVPNQIISLIPGRAGEPLTFGAWLTEAQINLSEDLTKTFEPKFLLGRYDGGERASAFLILGTKKYDAAFAALRQNETNLIPLFYVLTGRDSFRPAPLTPQFTDRLNHNLELRELVADGQTILLYAFLDQNTLVLAENEAALIEILARREI